MSVQQNRIDMAIEPKSDQINYDDFLVQPKTITVTNITSTGNKSDAQPISVHYEGDNGKPFKPCKSMRRVMVKIWGDDPTEYKGKSMTLYGDPDVIFAGKKVGGIRISHMSNMNSETDIPLSASKTKRFLYRVSPLKIEKVDQTANDDIHKSAEEAANKGSDSFRKFYKGLSPDQRAIVSQKMGDYQKAAEEVDKKSTDDTDDTKLNLLRSISEINSSLDLDIWQEDNKGDLDALKNLYPDDYKDVEDAFNKREVEITG